MMSSKPSMLPKPSFKQAPSVIPTRCPSGPPVVEPLPGTTIQSPAVAVVPPSRISAPRDPRASRITPSSNPTKARLTGRGDIGQQGVEQRTKEPSGAVVVSSGPLRRTGTYTSVVHPSTDATLTGTTCAATPFVTSATYSLAAVYAGKASQEILTSTATKSCKSVCTATSTLVYTSPTTIMAPSTVVCSNTYSKKRPSVDVVEHADVAIDTSVIADVTVMTSVSEKSRGVEASRESSLPGSTTPQMSGLRSPGFNRTLVVGRAKYRVPVVNDTVDHNTASVSESVSASDTLHAKDNFVTRQTQTVNTRSTQATSDVLVVDATTPAELDTTPAATIIHVIKTADEDTSQSVVTKYANCVELSEHSSQSLSNAHNKTLPLSAYNEASASPLLPQSPPPPPSLNFPGVTDTSRADGLVNCDVTLLSSLIPRELVTSHNEAVSITSEAIVSLGKPQSNAPRKLSAPGKIAVARCAFDKTFTQSVLAKGKAEPMQAALELKTSETFSAPEVESEGVTSSESDNMTSPTPANVTAPNSESMTSCKSDDVTSPKANEEASLKTIAHTSEIPTISRLQEPVNSSIPAAAAQVRRGKLAPPTRSKTSALRPQSDAAQQKFELGKTARVSSSIFKTSTGALNVAKQAKQENNSATGFAYRNGAGQRSNPLHRKLGGVAESVSTGAAQCTPLRRQSSSTSVCAPSQQGTPQLRRPVSSGASRGSNPHVNQLGKQADQRVKSMMDPQRCDSLSETSPLESTQVCDEKPVLLRRTDRGNNGEHDYSHHRSSLDLNVTYVEHFEQVIEASVTSETSQEKLNFVEANNAETTPADLSKEKLPCKQEAAVSKLPCPRSRGRPKSGLRFSKATTDIMTTSENDDISPIDKLKGLRIETTLQEDETLNRLASVSQKADVKNGCSVEVRQSQSFDLIQNLSLSATEHQNKIRDANTSSESVPESLVKSQTAANANCQGFFAPENLCDIESLSFDLSDMEASDHEPNVESTIKLNILSMSDLSLCTSVATFPSRSRSVSPTLSSTSSSPSIGSPRSISSELAMESLSSESLISIPNESESPICPPDGLLVRQSFDDVTAQPHGTIIQQEAAVMVQHSKITSIATRPSSIVSSPLSAGFVQRRCDSTKHASTSSLDNYQKGPTNANFRRIQRLENFGLVTTNTIREHLELKPNVPQMGRRRISSGQSVVIEDLNAARTLSCSQVTLQTVQTNASADGRQTRSSTDSSSVTLTSGHSAQGSMRRNDGTALSSDSHKVTSSRPTHDFDAGSEERIELDAKHALDQNVLHTQGLRMGPSTVKDIQVDKSSEVVRVEDKSPIGDVLLQSRGSIGLSSSVKLSRKSKLPASNMPTFSVANGRCDQMKENESLRNRAHLIDGKLKESNADCATESQIFGVRLSTDRKPEIAALLSSKFGRTPVHRQFAKPSQMEPNIVQSSQNPSSPIQPNLSQPSQPRFRILQPNPASQQKPSVTPLPPVIPQPSGVHRLVKPYSTAATSSRYTAFNSLFASREKQTPVVVNQPEIKVEQSLDQEISCPRESLVENEVAIRDGADQKMDDVQKLKSAFYGGLDSGLKKSYPHDARNEKKSMIATKITQGQDAVSQSKPLVNEPLVSSQPNDQVSDAIDLTSSDTKLKTNNNARQNDAAFYSSKIDPSTSLVDSPACKRKLPSDSEIRRVNIATASAYNMDWSSSQGHSEERKSSIENTRLSGNTAVSQLRPRGAWSNKAHHAAANQRAEKNSQASASSISYRRTSETLPPMTPTEIKRNLEGVRNKTFVTMKSSQSPTAITESDVDTKKDEVFVITYENADIIVLERAQNVLPVTSGENATHMTSSVVVSEQPQSMISPCYSVTPSASNLTSPESELRGIPISESGYDSWKSEDIEHSGPVTSDQGRARLRGQYEIVSSYVNTVAVLRENDCQKSTGRSEDINHSSRDQLESNISTRELKLSSRASNCDAQGHLESISSREKSAFQASNPKESVFYSNGADPQSNSMIFRHAVPPREMETSSRSGVATEAENAAQLKTTVLQKIHVNRLSSVSFEPFANGSRSGSLSLDNVSATNNCGRSPESTGPAVGVSSRLEDTIWEAKDGETSMEYQGRTPGSAVGSRYLGAGQGLCEQQSEYVLWRRQERSSRTYSANSTELVAKQHGDDVLWRRQDRLLKSPSEEQEQDQVTMKPSGDVLWQKRQWRPRSNELGIREVGHGPTLLSNKDLLSGERSQAVQPQTIRPRSHDMFRPSRPRSDEVLPRQETTQPIRSTHSFPVKNGDDSTSRQSGEEMRKREEARPSRPLSDDMLRRYTIGANKGLSARMPQPTYYESVCDDLLESMEANLSDSEAY